MATLTNILMAEQRDDAPTEASSTTQGKGDYFFLFENQVENRFAKPRKEPRRKRIFRRFSRKSKSGGSEWRRTSRLLPYLYTGEGISNGSPDTTALISEDEHSLIHSHVSCNNIFDDDDDDDEREDLVSVSASEGHDPRIIWPETLSMVGNEHVTSRALVESPKRDSAKRKVLMKKWKTRMRKSLRDALAKTQLSWSEDASKEYVVKVEDGSDGDISIDENDDTSKCSNISLLERAKRSLGVVSGRSKRVQRAKAALHEEDIGLYVNPEDDEVETVTKSTFEQLCVPSFCDSRDSAPNFPETVALDNGYAIAHLIHQGKTSLAVNYDSDCAQLELQSDDEYDPEDDISFDEEELGPALPELPSSESEETEYNLFNQSSVEEDNGTQRGEYPSLLAATSTVSEDPSLLGTAYALEKAWPLPQCRNQQDEVVLSGSSEDPLFVQQSTSTETFSVTSRRLGAAPPCTSVRQQQEESKDFGSASNSSDEEERRLGISCPAYATKATLDDAADVWKRIYAPPEEAPPSPTIVQKSTATWGCGLDASPVSVHSDITESEATAAAPTHNPFYNIRKYTSCGVVEEEDHPFDEVDSNACAPRSTPRQAQPASIGCGVPELVRNIKLSHKDDKVDSFTSSVGTNDENKSARPRCECVKCSVTNMYANLLAKKN